VNDAARGGDIDLLLLSKKIDLMGNSKSSGNCVRSWATNASILAQDACIDSVSRYDEQGIKCGDC
jgi:hypothetical protein